MAGFKVKMCTFFLEGTCTRGAQCTYAHGAHELQRTGGGGGVSPAFQAGLTDVLSIREKAKAMLTGGKFAGFEAGQGPPTKIQRTATGSVPGVGAGGGAAPAVERVEAWGTDQWGNPKKGHFKKTKQDTEEDEWLNASLVPEPTWLSFSPDFPLVQVGMASEAPALEYNKKQLCFQEGYYILSSLVPNIQEGEGFTIEHDDDWTKYPEVGESYKAATGVDHCFAIASCSEHKKWGIGLGGGKKGRESSAKLALALALATGSPMEAKLRAEFPSFDVLLDGGTKNAPKVKATRLINIAAGIEEPPPQVTPSWAKTGLTAIPIMLEGTTSSLLEEGYAIDAPAIQYDKEYNTVFGQAHKILMSLSGRERPVIVHDPDWSEFPEVGRAFNPAGLEADCFAVAKMPSAGKWAVGIAPSWKHRESACRLALAVAVATDSPAFWHTMNSYPDFGWLCSELGLC